MVASLIVGAVAAAVALLVPWQGRPPPVEAAGAGAVLAANVGLLHRWRGLWSGLAALMGVTWFSGPVGIGIAAGLGAVAWWWIGRTEPLGVRQARARARAQLPHLVILLGAALRAGAAPGPALEVVCRSLPGPASDRLASATARLALGGDPAVVWADLTSDPELATLGRCLARAHSTGAPVAQAVARLGQELADERRALAQDRARTVGVKAAVPLGLCLLPAFLLLGIVPVVAGLAGALLAP